jgi:hypothetical protein
MSDRDGFYTRTYTGRVFWPLSPRPQDVVIEDIGHALALTTRFGGHTRVPYSVAQHSVMMARAVSGDDELRRWCLMHDAAEAYVGDMVKPLKVAPGLSEFSVIEDRILMAIAERFGLLWPLPPELKRIDVEMLNSEARDLLKGSQFWKGRKCLYELPVTPWPWWKARFEFMEEFSRLWNLSGPWDFPVDDPPSILISHGDLGDLLVELARLRALRDVAHVKANHKLHEARNAAAAAPGE